MEEEKLTKNIDIRSNKYSKNGFDYYCRNSYGKFHIPMDHLTPEDLRAIADHLENNPPLNRDSLAERQVRGIFEELRNFKKTEQPRRGYRFFECESCKHSWKEESRDAKSPSGSTCPKCSEESHPVGYEIDPIIYVDEYGNLI